MSRPLLVLLLLPALLLASCGSNSTSGNTSTTSARDLLGFSSSQLGSAYVGDNYSGTIAATGGTAPYSVRLVSGKLPEGLKFSGGSSATISGTPTVAGSSSFRLEVTDANLSVRSQDFNLTVAELPPLDFDAALPSGEVRGETRIPLRVLGARTVRAARYIWKLPEGVTVSKVQAESSAAAGRPVVAWKQAGQTLTLDFGFRTVPKNAAQVALITVKPAGDKPFSLTKPVSGTDSFVTALDGSGKSIREVKTPEAQAAAKKDEKKDDKAAPAPQTTSQAAPAAQPQAKPAEVKPTATPTPATTTPATTQPATQPAPATPAAPATNGGKQ